MRNVIGQVKDVAALFELQKGRIMGEKREAVLGIGQMKKGEAEIQLPHIPQFAPVAVEKVQAVSILLVSFLTKQSSSK